MFREKWREDILPSIFTAITIFSILYLIRLGQNIVLTSFAASAFIVFTLPENVTAQPQNVLGGHLIGFMSAALTTILGKPAQIPALIIIAISLAISTFAMSILDLHHPPANGTTLAVALNGLSQGVIISIGVSLLLLLFFNTVYKRWFYKPIQ